LFPEQNLKTSKSKFSLTRPTWENVPNHVLACRTTCNYMLLSNSKTCRNSVLLVFPTCGNKRILANTKNQQIHLQQICNESKYKPPYSTPGPAALPGASGGLETAPHSSTHWH
jgi:hypothetical protein